ncbi:MAG: hypothetical protein AB4372_03665 [Xenococcus sp. (in: cyanobacteria)]
MSNSENIILLCQKNDEYLKTLQKALVFDEQDINNFENTYHEMLSEMIDNNWRIHRIAEELNQKEFRRILENI